MSGSQPTGRPLPGRRFGVCNVARTLQTQTSHAMMTFLTPDTSQDLWDDFARKMGKRESLTEMLARLEAAGVIEPPPPAQDPFVAAFQSMSFKTPVPLAPETGVLGLLGSLRRSEQLASSSASVSPVEAAATTVGEQGVEEEAMLKDGNDRGAAGAGVEAVQTPAQTQAVPGTLAAMLEGVMDLDFVDDEDEDEGVHDAFSMQFDSASPTPSGDEIETEDGKSATHHPPQHHRPPLESSPSDQPPLLQESVPISGGQASSSATGEPRAALRSRSSQTATAVDEQAQTSSILSLPLVTEPALPRSLGTNNIVETRHHFQQKGVKHPEAESQTAEALEVDAEEEGLQYEMRVVYVTDTTIGLRTTWDDNFEVVEEINLATGDLTADQAQEEQSAPAAVDTSPAAVKSTGDGVEPSGGKQGPSEERQGKVDKRVDAPTALDVGIARGMLVRVKSKKSRYRNLVGIVTSIIGNGKRVRIQFAGMKVTALLQASTLEPVDVAGDAQPETVNDAADALAAGIEQPDTSRQDSGGAAVGAVSGVAERMGGAFVGIMGSVQRLLPARVTAAVQRGVGRGGQLGMGRRLAVAAPRRAGLRAQASGDVGGHGDGAARDSNDESLAEEEGAAGGGPGLSRMGGPGRVARGGRSGVGRPGSLPVGYSFKRPASGSETNPCVEGDMAPWTHELYGASGRRDKSGP